LTAGGRILNTPDLSSLKGIVLDNEEPVFSEPWEAQAFALVIGLYEKNAFTWSEWAEVLSKTIHSDDGCTPYYWQKALLATPHGQPIELQNADKS